MEECSQESKDRNSNEESTINYLFIEKDKKIKKKDMNYLKEDHMKMGLKR